MAKKFRRDLQCSALEQAVKNGEFLSVFSGEWLIAHSNSGGVILARALISALLLFAAALAAAELLDDEFFTRAKVLARLSWFGAAFAGVYAALYTRFASQWSYLAGVYNNIRRVESSTASFGKRQTEALLSWKVGFIVDAWALHLIGKDPFAGTIAGWIVRTDGLLKRYDEMNGHADLVENVIPVLEPHLSDEQKRTLRERVAGYEAEKGSDEQPKDRSRRARRRRGRASRASSS